MYYFAYGSNMLHDRIRKRIPTVIVYDVGWARGWVLEFNKKSRDGSAKCTIRETGDLRNVVYGVIYQLSWMSKERLDYLEGVGYGYYNRSITIHGTYRHGEGKFLDIVTPTTYVAETEYIDNSLHPYTWYKAHVLKGAIENNLPQEYVDIIANVKAVEDPWRKRRPQSKRRRCR